jgi:hypothetical protein
VVHRNASLLVMWTALKMSAISVERVASCREALVASRANLASVFSLVTMRGLSADFLGIGIYPIETLKTQMMSNTGEPNRTLASAAKRIWALGGLKAYYRGLGVRNAYLVARPPRKSLN